MSVWFSCVCVEDSIIDDDPPMMHHAYEARDKFVIFTGPLGSPDDEAAIDEALNNFGMNGRKCRRIGAPIVLEALIIVFQNMIGNGRRVSFPVRIGSRIRGKCQ